MEEMEQSFNLKKKKKRKANPQEDIIIRALSDLPELKKYNDFWLKNWKTKENIHYWELNYCSVKTGEMN